MFLDRRACSALRYRAAFEAPTALYATELQLIASTALYPADKGRFRHVKSVFFLILAVVVGHTYFTFYKYVFGLDVWSFVAEILARKLYTITTWLHLNISKNSKYGLVLQVTHLTVERRLVRFPCASIFLHLSNFCYFIFLHNEASDTQTKNIFITSKVCPTTFCQN
jgi:hypothetical protein